MCLLRGTDCSLNTIRGRFSLRSIKVLVIMSWRTTYTSLPFVACFYPDFLRDPQGHLTRHWFIFGVRCLWWDCVIYFSSAHVEESDSVRQTSGLCFVSFHLDWSVYFPFLSLTSTTHPEAFTVKLSIRQTTCAVQFVGDTAKPYIYIYIYMHASRILLFIITFRGVRRSSHVIEPKVYVLFILSSL